MATSQANTTRTRHSQSVDRKKPFRQHLQELRRRFFYIMLAIGFWCVVTYAFEQQIIKILLHPAHEQQFIYTSPIGGVDFLFRVSIYAALILSIPVILYNILSYIEPLITHSSKQFVALSSFAAGILAAGGILFGYFVGLPAAMHFLLHQFTTLQIRPLLTIQSYLSFVMVYMLGSALILQIPLLLIFINRIKPLKPQQLFHYERWVILGSFVMSGLMNPTPNLFDQLLVAGPLIMMYQVGILIVYIINRRLVPHRQPKKLPIRTHAERELYKSFSADQLLDVALPAVRSLEQKQSVAAVQHKRAFDVVATRRSAPTARHGLQRVIPANQGAPLARPRQYIDGFIMARRDGLNAVRESTYDP